jgi:hypothetical protein
MSDNSEFRRMMDLVNPTEPVFEEITLEDDDSFHAEFGYLGYIPEGDDEVELEEDDSVEATLVKHLKSVKDPHNEIYQILSNPKKYGQELSQYVSRDYDSTAGEYGLHGDDDFEDIIDRMLADRDIHEADDQEVESWIDEAEYQGRKVKLNKPMRGDVKKFKVYVKNEKGNVVKVNFGDPNMKIKKHIPGRRKSFRARHNCDNPGPKTKARYWSCRAW